MVHIKHFFTVLFLHIVALVYSQTVIITGHVSDKQGNSIFAVNAYLLHQNKTGTATDLDGNFRLELPKPEILKNEYLVFSFIGYQQCRISLDSIDFTKSLKIILVENSHALKEVFVDGQKTISREFSIKEMDKLKIYLSPLASGDPLKAISMLPSSTNTSETANPELRGSEANRTKVFLNGVPVSSPVRNSQINGIGFFSLFNPEMIKNLSVYPSNPPLIYGNTSAGIVDIETEGKLDNNNYQFSSTLATMGICASQKMNKDNFIQLYGNLMFSNGFLFINPGVNESLKSFKSNDAGINFHSEITKSVSFNFYNYLVSESSNVLINLLTSEDHAKAKKIRDFTVINFKYHKARNHVSFNAGTNFSNSDFSFGNMISSGKQYQSYLSLNYKYIFSDEINLQTGICNEHGNFRFNDEVPVFFYALSPVSPSFHADTSLTNNLPEAYFYLRWRPLKNIIWGAGVRKNFEIIHSINVNYWSLQTNLRYNLLSSHSLLFSAGKYNNLTEPDYSMKEFRLLSSRQVALEYLYETKNTKINLAAYIKSETGDSLGNKKINGVEIYAEHNISHRLKASISNTFINSEMDNQERIYKADNNVGRFLVFTMSYFNLKLFNTALSWTNRPGKLYTPVINSIYNPVVDFYLPLLSNNLNCRRYGKYNSINLSLNKMFPFNTYSLIAFISISNLLNTKNQRSIIYSKDYSASSYDYYQKRSIYFGIVLSFQQEKDKL